MFDHILLEDEQVQLLSVLVEASRNVPTEERQKFHAAQTLGQHLAFIIHQGMPKDFPGAYIGDIEILAQQGFLNLSYGKYRSVNFDVTPIGFKYYEYIMNLIEEPTKRIETSINEYINSNYFRSKYSSAYKKWSEAEEKLWESETEKQLTVIGHLCRESIQLFVSTLITLKNPDNYDKEVSHTVSRLKSVINFNKENLGETELEFCLALISCWGSVSDLIQRQEHGAQKEGEKISWEDGRRIVFQTMIIMYEIDRSLFA